MSRPCCSLGSYTCSEGLALGQNTLMMMISCINGINEHSSFSDISVTSSTSQLILQLFRRFNNVTAHSPTFSLLHLCHSSFSNNFFLHLHHSSFSNSSFALPTSQLILQPFRHFTYVTAHSPTLPLLHLRHSSFSNPSFASPTSQALHLIHLASRPYFTGFSYIFYLQCT